MGCGKSSFGRRLATQLEMDFVDTDREIERLAGATIPVIFEKKGEVWFRELEKRVVNGLPDIKRDTVVALGGGAACREGVMELLNAAGKTVYLRMSTDRLVQRIDQNGREKRPKIKGMDDKELTDYINKVLPEREIYYNRANFVLDCGGISDQQVVGRLLQQLR